MSDPLALELQPGEVPCGCWVSNSGPLEKQPALLTAEPSLPEVTFTFDEAETPLPRWGTLMANVLAI